MKLINEKLLNNTLKFFKNIKKEDKIAVIHHTDPDGICSGVIVSKAVEKLRDAKIDLRLNQNSSELFISEETVKRLEENGINKVIITDMGVDQQVEENFVEKITDFAELVIIDHHKLYRDLNSEKITLIKPHMIYEDVDSAQYCAAKFCFDILSKILDLSEFDWIATIGIIGDCGYNTWKGFVDDVLTKYDIELKQNGFDTEIGQIAEIISSTEAFDINKVELAFDIVYNANSYKDVLNSELKQYKEDIDNEIKIWRNEVEKRAEIKGNIIYYHIKNPKYPIKSNLCTLLSFDFPDKSIIIVQEYDNDELITVSARRRDNKIKMNELLESATKGLKRGGGGGHIPAAGGRFLKKDKKIFKERVLEWLKNT